jgi:DGQHR domain-containing protein
VSIDLHTEIKAMFTFQNSTVKFVSHKSLDEAINTATQAAGISGGYASPCVLFRQGNRTMIAGAIPFKMVMERLITESAPDASTIEQVKAARNRPEDAAHSGAIGEYIRENVNGKFILPPLTLNLSEEIIVHGVEYDPEPPTKNGMLIIPMSAKIDITDGQHRRSGIAQAYRNLLREKQKLLDSSSVAVMITCEAEISQVHQDFADCSRTKPLASSQLAVYDRRNPANALVIDLIDQVPLFAGKVDSSSAKLSKKSPAPFLTNQVRQAVKVLMTGGYGISELDFEEKAKAELASSTSSEYHAKRDAYVAFMTTVVDAIPVFKEVAALTPDLLKTRVPAFRDEGWVCLSATGLNMLARIGFEMIRDGEANWRVYVKRLGEVDWRRTADLWKGNVVSDDGHRILTAHKAFRAGVEVLKNRISWAAKVADAEGMEGPDIPETQEVEAAA